MVIAPFYRFRELPSAKRVQESVHPHRVLAMGLALLSIFYFYSFLGTFSLSVGSPLTPGQVTFVLVGGGAVTGTLGLMNGDRYSRGLFIAAALYIALIAVNRAFTPHDPLLVRDRAAFMLALIAGVAVFGSLTRFDRLITALQVVVLAACVLNAFDYFARGVLPFTMSPIVGRAGGLYVNPNTSAAHIALAVPLICGMARRKVSLALYAITFLGILLTLSRSGMIIWIAAVAMTELFVRPRRGLAPRAIAFVAAAGFLALVIAIAGRTIAEGLIDILGNYLPAGLRDRLLLDMGDFSAKDRQYVAGAAWRLFLDHPWTGSGVGLPGRWDYNQMPHNTVLLTLAEFGLLGAAWLCIFLRALQRIGGPFGFSLIVLWILAAMFSHNMFDQTSIAVLIAMYWAGAIRSEAVYTPARLKARQSDLANQAVRA